MKVKITSPTHAPARFHGKRGQIGLGGLADYCGITQIMDWSKVARSINFWRKASGSCTISVGDPCVITKNDHSLVAGDIVRFNVSGVVPSGFPTDGSRLYVLPTNLTSNTFTVSTTLNGTALVTTGTATGTYSIQHATGMDAFDMGMQDPTTGDIAIPVRSDVTGYDFYWFTPTAGPTWAGEVWEYYFDGAAGGTVGVTQYDGTEIPVVKAPGLLEHTWIGDTSRSFSVTITDRNNPPRNFKIYQKRYKNDTIIRGKTYLGYSNGGRFVPEWLSQISEFGVLRFMDWMGANNGNVVNYDEIATPDYFRWTAWPGSTSPKGLFPIELIAEIATLTGANIHVNIPHTAGESYVQAMSEILRDNVPVGQTVSYEYSNEIWNTMFAQTGWASQQGAAKYNSGDDFGDGIRYAGYRGTQLHKVIYDVYGGTIGRNRWRGVLPSFTLSTDITQGKINGFNDWKSETGSSLTLNDLYDEVAITGYFGDIPGGIGISSIVTGSNTTITSDVAYGLKTDDKIIFSFYNLDDYHDGMDELNGQTATVTSIVSTSPFIITIDIDTTGYTPLNAVPRNAYYTFATEWNMMDESINKHNNDPTNYPSQYTYYRQQLANSFVTGSCDYGYKTSQNLTYFKKSDGPWLAQKTLCDQYGLDLTQYESGCHHVGSTYVTGWHGSQTPINGDPDQGWTFPWNSIYNSGNLIGARFTEWNLAQSHSRETAAVYYEGMRRFEEIGGKYPSKFVEGGAVGRYGTWGGMRWARRGTSEGDINNPVWKATVAHNRVNMKRPIRRDISPHRYWRIIGSDSTGVFPADRGYGFNIVGFNIAVVDQTGSGIASASSTYSGSSADNAFDRNGSTHWDSDFTDTWPQWIAYDFGEGNEKAIDGVGIAPSSSARAPTGFDVQYSDNGTDWTTSFSVNGLTSDDWPGGLNIFEKPNPQY